MFCLTGLKRLRDVGFPECCAHIHRQNTSMNCNSVYPLFYLRAKGTPRGISQSLAPPSPATGEAEQGPRHGSFWVQVFQGLASWVEKKLGFGFGSQGMGQRKLIRGSVT